MTPRLAWIIIGLSLAAFALRGTIYVGIGSPLPAVFAGVAISGLVLGRLAGETAWRWAVRFWGCFLILYGLGRIGLYALLKAAPVSSPHALEHTGAVFLIVSIAHLVAGMALVGPARPRRR